MIFSQAQNNAKEALIDLGGKLADRVALGAMRWVSAALFLGTAAWNLFNH